MDENYLLLGSIAPDISKQIGETKEISHFLDHSNEDDIPNIDRFLSKYRSELNNPFEMGYFIHLLTDKYWFRDYVYIPLGGNRKGLKRQILNILIVWSLTGFWHGANWNFILWGIYFFVFLVIEKVFLLKHLKNGFLSHLYTILLVLISFVIFNVESISEIGIFIKSIFGINGLSFMNFETWYYLKNYIVILVIGIICSTPIIKKGLDKLADSKTKILTILELVIYIGLLIICSAALISNSFNPFIYFRF